MNTVLSDEDILKRYTQTTGKRVPHDDLNRETLFIIARAIESAVLARVADRLKDAGSDELV